MLNSSKFKHTPLILKELGSAEYVVVTDNTLAKPALAPRYPGPLPVLEKNWEKSYVKLQMPRGQDDVAIVRSKAACSIVTWGEVCCANRSNDRAQALGEKISVQSNDVLVYKFCP